MEAEELERGYNQCCDLFLTCNLVSIPRASALLILLGGRDQIPVLKDQLFVYAQASTSNEDYVFHLSVVFHDKVAFLEHFDS